MGKINLSQLRKVRTHFRIHLNSKIIRAARIIIPLRAMRGGPFSKAGSSR